MIYVFLADGFEETEALTPTDILRRSGLDVATVGVGKQTVTGAHGIKVTADITADKIKLDGTLEAVVLPGGMPGTLNLEKNKEVQAAIDYAAENGLLTAAICAAPSVLGHKGLLNGKKATCYPGFEKDLLGAAVSGDGTVRDGNLITGNGPGAAFEFGFLIAEYFKGKAASKEVARQMQYLK